MAHFSAGHADRDAILSDGEIVLVFYLYAAFLIEIDEGSDAVSLEVLIKRHSIMSRIQKDFGDMDIRKECLHGKPVVKESMGVMHGSRIQQRKDRQVAFRIGSGHHVQVIAVIKAASGRIPANIAIRLRIMTQALAVGYAFFLTIAGAFAALSCGSHDGSAVAGKRKRRGIKKPLLCGDIQKVGFKEIKQTAVRLLVRGRIDVQCFQEFFHRNLFDGCCFGSFLEGFFTFALGR